MATMPCGGGKRWVMQGYTHQFAPMVLAFRQQFMDYNPTTGHWEQRGRTRRSRDRDRDAHVAVHPTHGSYAVRLKATITHAFSRMSASSVLDFVVRGTMCTGYAAEATCSKRGWGKANKQLRLKVPPSWLKVFRECGGVMDGYIVGAILSQTDDTMVRWAIKPMSPVDRTTWWRASFAKVNGEWRLDRFLRNGAMGAGGGK